MVTILKRIKTIVERIKKVFSSIKWQLVLTYFLIILFVMMSVGIYVIKLLKDYSINQKQIATLTQANIIADYIAGHDIAYEPYIDDILEQLKVGQGVSVFVVDTDAKVVADSTGQAGLIGKILIEEPIVNALKGKNYAKSIKDTAKDETVISAAVPVMRDRAITGAVYIQVPADDIDRYVEHLTSSLYTLSLIVSVLIGIFSFVVASIITYPVGVLTQKMKNALTSDELELLEVKGSNEISELVDAFNQMSNRIKQQEEKRQEFVSNASHELKTPLSSIKLICDSLLQTQDTSPELVRDFLNDMNAEVDRLTKIIDKLLTLTKLDMNRFVPGLVFQNENINDIVRAVLKALMPLAVQKNIELDFSSEDEIVMSVEHDRLWEAVYNLVDNSIKYTPEGGRVAVSVRKEDRNAIITVTDTGIGIAPEEKYRIFDRFYRVDKARARETGGTGLGLSIALSAVQMHGGRIEVESEEGRGSKFTIILPIVLEQS